MNKKILLLITSSLALAACAPSPPRPTPDNRVACPGGGSNVITIVANTARFSVAPPHLCIKGDPNNDVEIKVNFTGNNAAGVITLAPKSGVTAPWLNASNPGPGPNSGQTTITVPAGTTEDTYYYTITATGWGTIDPMITVE